MDGGSALVNGWHEKLRSIRKLLTIAQQPGEDRTATEGSQEPTVPTGRHDVNCQQPEQLTARMTEMLKSAEVQLPPSLQMSVKEASEAHQ